jgi:branched-chain amino acid aminotransferase
MGFASVNGIVVPAEEARVSVFDNGFAFGDSVYEVLRTYDGLAFEPARHFRRLRTSAARLGFCPGPRHRPAGRRTPSAGGTVNPSPDHRQPRPRGRHHWRGPTVVMIQRSPTPPNARAASVAAVGVRRNHPRPTPRRRAITNNILAVREAQSRGAEEPVLLNQEGFLAEGASTNVFLARGGTILTPPLSTGILAGITREVVLELLPGLGIPFREEPLHLDDLLAADEAFMTSTTREVVPVKQVDETPIGNGRPGPLTRRVMAAFGAHAPAHCGQGALTAAATPSGRTTG